MTNQYLLELIAGRNPNLRAADTDRDRIAERLRNSHAEGRLDLAEFQQRLERCYQAKTYRELDELVSDLPRGDDQVEQHPSGWSPPRHWRLAPLAPILIALILISAATGHYIFWLWIPLVFVAFRTSWRRRGRPWTGRRRGPDGWI
jgi:hypothetical protein